jgi:virulence-associated protein E
VRAFEPAPTFTIDSGNGLQLLWRLEQPVELADDPARIADVEARNHALALALGADPSTRNVDRILRLPGTTNHPNRKKRALGRVAVPSRLVEFNDVAHPLSAFAPHQGEELKEEEEREEVEAGAVDSDELRRTIEDGGGGRHGASRSHSVWYVACEALRRGYRKKMVVDVLLDRSNRISDHLYDQSDPRASAERQVENAAAAITFATDNAGRPLANPTNIRVALLKLGVEVRYDEFADRTLITGLERFGPLLDDAAVDRLWLTFDERFHFRPQRGMLFTVLADTARLCSFHPVHEYLDGLRWDGAPRVDEWLTTYAGVKDSEYARAVGSLFLIAAVRRVRRPGCKFDEMLVLEHPEQGNNKSTALAILAVRDEWFSDDLPLNADPKRVIESLRGRWIVEAAELSGMRRADVEHLKAFLSRQVDRARLSYDRLITERPRQCVIAGTTNLNEYLRDTTGNRRMWPVAVRGFNVEALRRDRDQLWAEAAAREARGDRIRLDPSLWEAAGREQAERLTQDPYYEALAEELDRFEGPLKIAAADVWTIMEVKPGQRSQDQNRRVGEAMRKLGWRRPNTAGNVRLEGKLVSGYVKGEQPWRTLSARRRYDKETGERWLEVWCADEDRPEVGRSIPPWESDKPPF